MDIGKKANTYLLLALLLGAAMPVMLDLAASANIYEFLFFAYVLSTAGSLIFAVKSGKMGRLSSYLKNRRSFSLLVVIGLLNYAFLEFGLLVAERSVGASLATVVYRSYPVLMLLFLPLILRESVTKRQIAALVLAFLGIYIALTGGAALSISTAEVLPIALLVGIALMSAIGTTLVKKFAFDMESSMFIFNLANLAFFGILFAAAGFPHEALSAASILALVYVGVVYNVFVGFMYYWSLRAIKTTLFTNIYFLSPFVTFVFSYLILGEPIRVYYLAIAALVSAGIIIQRKDTKGGTYHSKKAETHREFPLFDVTGAFGNSDAPYITSALDSDGRILAARVNPEHVGIVDDILMNDRDFMGYAESSIILRPGSELHVEESRYIKAAIGASDSDHILISIGDMDYSEGFFELLAQKAGNGPFVNSDNKFTK